MRFIKDHVIPALMLVFGALWSLYGVMSGAYDLWTAGMPVWAWFCIGLMIFFASVAVLLYQFHRSLSVWVKPDKENAIVAATVPDPPQSARIDPFQTYFVKLELRIADLVPTGRPLIQDKTFEECVIYGPAMISLSGDRPNFMDRCAIEGSLETNFVEVAAGRSVIGIVQLGGCTLRRCKLRGIGFIGTAAQIENAKQGFK